MSIFKKSVAGSGDADIVKKLSELKPDNGDLFKKSDLVDFVAGEGADFKDKYKVGLKLGVMLKGAVDDGWLERIKIGTYKVIDPDKWWKEEEEDEKKKK